MTEPQDIDYLVPKLRRFARASTADKELADDCVQKALEHLLRSNEAGALDQVRLYRAVEHFLERDAGGSFEKQCWRALILVFVEEFSAYEAGQILGVDAKLVTQMVTSAEKHVRKALKDNVS